MKFRLPSRISTIGATAGAASSSVASAGRSAAVKQEDGRSLEAFDQRGHIKAADVIAILDAGGPQAPSSAVSAFWLACWAEIRRQVELCGTDGGPTSPFRTTEVDAAISLMGMFMSGGGERSPEPSQSFLVKLRDGDEELRVAVLRGSEAVPPESEGVWVPIEFARGIVGPKWDQHPALAVKVHPPRSNSGASASEDSNNGDEDSSQTVAEPPVVIDPAQLTLINPLQPLTTPLWLTSIDGIYVYITWLHRTLPPTPGQGIALLRRVDNDMINATLLLHAGGLETDQERTIVLSLERQRVRCRKGMLFGTWVPLARARDLARGVCLDQRLGGFLEESLGLGVFGLDHPSDKKKRKKKRKVAAQQASLDTSWIEMVEDEEADKEEAERASKRVKTESASPGPSPGVTVEAQVPVNPAVVPPVTTLPQIPPYPIPIAIPTPIPLVVPVATTTTVPSLTANGHSTAAANAAAASAATTAAAAASGPAAIALATEMATTAAVTQLAARLKAANLAPNVISAALTALQQGAKLINAAARMKGNGLGKTALMAIPTPASILSAFAESIRGQGGTPGVAASGLPTTGIPTWLTAATAGGTAPLISTGATLAPGVAALANGAGRGRGRGVAAVKPKKEKPKERKPIRRRTNYIPPPEGAAPVGVNGTNGSHAMPGVSTSVIPRVVPAPSSSSAVPAITKPVPVKGVMPPLPNGRPSASANGSAIAVDEDDDNAEEDDDDEDEDEEEEESSEEEDEEDFAPPPKGRGKGKGKEPSVGGKGKVKEPSAQGGNGKGKGKEPSHGVKGKGKNGGVLQTV